MEEKTAEFPIKILYESRLLSVDDYKTLLYGESEEREEQKYKNSNDTTLEEMKNTIYKTLPCEVNRNNFINNMPWGNI
jgi:hypothetical protein